MIIERLNALFELLYSGMLNKEASLLLAVGRY